MPCEKHGPRASVKKNPIGLRPRFLSTESLVITVPHCVLQYMTCGMQEADMPTLKHICANIA